MTGTFIALEGADGAGKSSQAQLLADALIDRGLDVVRVREPGGTALGEAVRELLLDPASGELDVRTELFLFLAARAELTRTRIRPALERGAVVLADRFFASTAVYQGHAHLGEQPLPMARIVEMAHVATYDLVPDLTLVFDIGVDTLRQRLAQTKAGADRIEGRGDAFFAAVIDGYRAYAACAKEPVVLIDATRAIEAIFADVLAACLPVCAASGHRP